MNHPVIVNGVEIKPLLTHHQAQNQLFVHGEDEKGPYVACQLHNRWDSPFYRWYVFVSPEDLDLMRNYRWIGNISGRTDNKSIEIRRRETIDSKLYSIQLRREIWERMGKEPIRAILLLGHPLDFRRANLSPICTKAYTSGLEKVCRGVTWSKNGWQIQIQVKGKTLYLGRVKNPEDGYRIYNRYLRALKSEYPEDGFIRAAVYNDIDPMF